ncbi:hypothetical protein GCM10023214_02050 [Amycolatopsis dongchuanensis]|uniref:Uncharacterized protein n=1 Tax=Amycolatopsis dongchuanensis TaxID=1070866 RepID=A0ABP9PTI9_9PSEU
MAGPDVLSGPAVFALVGLGRVGKRLVRAPRGHPALAAPLGCPAARVAPGRATLAGSLI